MKVGLVYVAFAITLVGALLLARLPPEPQPEMPPSWRTWLVFERPHGYFRGQDYWYCDNRDGGRWVVYQSTGSWYMTDRVCWLWMLPSSLSD